MNNGIYSSFLSSSEACGMPVGLQSAIGTPNTYSLDSMPFGMTQDNIDHSFVGIYSITGDSSSSGSGSAGFSAGWGGFGRNIYVYWGDGTVSFVNAGNLISMTSHVYTSSGLYVVRSVATTMFNLGVGSQSAFSRLVRVLSFPSTVQTINLRGATRLVEVPTDIPRTVTTLSNAFNSCSIFNQPLDSWNVSNVTSMASMFSGCSRFNQPLGSWNTKQVVFFSSMFSNCVSLNQDFSTWDFTSCETLNSFMSNVRLNTSYYDALLILWDTYKTTWFQGGLAMTVNMGNSKYSVGSATTARTNLVNYGWTITDGGQE